MSFGESVRTCINKYATFDGRASRSEFWWFYLFYVLVSMVSYIPVIIVGVLAGSGDSGFVTVIWGFFMIFWAVFILGLIIPLLAVGCRRLHDRGQSGWLQLLLFVPCGGIVLLVFWVMEGTPGDNAYGPRPA